MLEQIIEIGYRGSKSVILKQASQNQSIIVKEQRVDGSCRGWARLRYTLTDLKINYQNRIHSNQINKQTVRSYSVLNNDKLANNKIIDPWFITGFVNAEGCFRISLTKRDNAVGWRVQLFFQIALHEKDKALLENIQNYWGVGKIYKSGKNMIQYKIQILEEFEVLIKHFDSYPLISQKRSDYELFKKAYNLVLYKEHLTIKGLHNIVALRASLNLGLSEELKIYFSDIIPELKPIIKDQSIPNSHWLAGFTSGEGCFLVGMSKSAAYSTGFQVYLVFIITQHIRDKELMNSLIEYLGCGKIQRKRDVYEYQVTKFIDIETRIIPFFNENIILGIKSQDFNDWCIVSQLMKEKKHLTKEGVDKIIEIKNNMNKSRQWY